ncbi:hypothetical protein SAMN04487983_1003192 [Streptomyces sp. yr375]|uniref:hypothetical protein n=1 Tax=Streptomyces sp. yr375 TaxID=1761906 RepID=UPI0008D7823E|nr:hypothetical protein [Streptomyces sp. yr375]SEQ15334.1 hypothetical protein SAMN04487983_1003192 [Streptomyces sp. yr375]
MSLQFQRNADGTITGRNIKTGFTLTSADEEEVQRLVHEDAGWEYTPPPTPPPPGFHRFTLVHDEFGYGSFGDEPYDSLRTRPPNGCEPVDWGCFALKCERPGASLLGAVSDTVAEIRREHGLVMNSLGVEKPDEWFGDDRNGYGAQIVAHLMLTAAHRAARLGYGRKDLVRLLDAAGVR